MDLQDFFAVFTHVTISKIDDNAHSLYQTVSFHDYEPKYIDLKLNEA